MYSFVDRSPFLLIGTSCTIGGGGARVLPGQGRGGVLGCGAGAVWLGRECVGRRRGGCASLPLKGSLSGSLGLGGRC